MACSRAPRWRDLGVLALALVAVHSASSPGGDAPDRTVLVYLANETRPAAAGRRNLDVVTAWLRAATAPEIRAVADRIAVDRTVFPATVDREVRALVRSGPRGLVVATNASLRSGAVLVRDRRSALRREPFPARAPTGDCVADDHPMLAPGVLERVLDAAARRFPPAEHRFVLLLKSHGTPGYAAVPRVSVRHDASSSDQVRAFASGEAPGGGPRLGLSRARLLAILDRLGRERGMRFPLVVLEACASGVGLAPGDLPDCVGAVAAAPGELGYRSFDHTALGLDAPAEGLLAQIRAGGALRVVRAPDPGRPWACAGLLFGLWIAARAGHGRPAAGSAAFSGFRSPPAPRRTR